MHSGDYKLAAPGLHKFVEQGEPSICNGLGTLSEVLPEVCGED